MLMPMETLSLITTRTDSGAGVRQRDGSGSNSGGFSSFGEMFDNHLQSSSQPNRRPGTSAEQTSESTKPVIDNKKDESEEETGAEYAIGVMGNQQLEVVFILEGDSKTVTDQLRVNDNVEPPITVDTDEINKEVLTTDAENKPFELNLEEETVKANATVTGAEAVKAGEHVNEAERATAKPAELYNTNEAGEAEARMPNMRTQDSQYNLNQEANSSATGNPSPLENENETEMQGQETSYRAEDALRNALNTVKETENQTEPVETPILGDIAPPLSESLKPEQFIATQQIKSEAMYAPVKVENLFEEMISRVQTMQNDKLTSMTIQLNPEFLGNVQLEVGMDAAGLHVRINAEDSGVRGMINSQLTALIESLEHKGIEVVKVEVAYTGVGYDTHKDPHGSRDNQSQTGKQRRYNREVDSKDGVTIYGAVSKVQEYYLDTGVSSVEYSA